MFTGPRILIGIVLFITLLCSPAFSVDDSYWWGFLYDGCEINGRDVFRIYELGDASMYDRARRFALNNELGRLTSYEVAAEALELRAGTMSDVAAVAAGRIRDMARKCPCPEVNELLLTAGFAASLKYTPENDEYWSYPGEMLAGNGLGDCDYRGSSPKNRSSRK